MRETTKNILKWACTVFFALGFFVYVPHISGFLSLIVATFIAPIPKWKNFLGRYVKGKMKSLVVAVLIILTFMTAPTTEAPNAENVGTIVEEAQGTLLVVEATIAPTIEPTVEPTLEPTSTPEPTVEPTHEPTPTPTVAPTSAPTAEPTPPPTAAPTATIVESTGGQMTNQQYEPIQDVGQNYVANKNTKKFHYPSCSSADDIKPENRWDYFGTRDEIINLEYVPCKRCNP